LAGSGAIEETRRFLETRTAIRPRVAVVLGSGLGAFAGELKGAERIPYQGIPNWAAATAIGHAGELIFGRLDGVETVIMAGRAHLYEGYTPQQVAFGVRVLGAMGVRSLVLTNAAGGINLDYTRGALVLISDHINLQGCSPLVGENLEWLGPRFPDMTEAYSTRLREIAKEVAQQVGITLREGVYAAMLGPSYETPAEIRYLRTIGADLVGMSTVPESLAGNHMGMEVLGISCVTNMAAGILPKKLDHREVLETGEAVRDDFIRLLKALLPRLEP
jgi:purine-nucleoside phosphorylase